MYRSGRRPVHPVSVYGNFRSKAESDSSDDSVVHSDNESEVSDTDLSVVSDPVVPGATKYTIKTKKPDFYERITVGRTSYRSRASKKSYSDWPAWNWGFLLQSLFITLPLLYGAKSLIESSSLSLLTASSYASKIQEGLSAQAEVVDVQGIFEEHLNLSAVLGNNMDVGKIIWKFSKHLSFEKSDEVGRVFWKVYTIATKVDTSVATFNLLIAALVPDVLERNEHLMTILESSVSDKNAFDRAYSVETGLGLRGLGLYESSRQLQFLFDAGSEQFKYFDELEEAVTRTLTLLHSTTLTGKKKIISDFLGERLSKWRLLDAVFKDEVNWNEAAIQNMEMHLESIKITKNRLHYGMMKIQSIQTRIDRLRHLTLSRSLQTFQGDNLEAWRDGVANLIETLKSAENSEWQELLQDFYLWQGI